MHASSRAISLLSLLALIAVGHGAPARAERVRFRIPAGPAATTLRQFADQSDMDILFRSDEVGPQETRAVSGKLEPREALHRMLAGSGLRYQFRDPDGVVVNAPGGGWPSLEDTCEVPDVGRPCNDQQPGARALVKVTAQHDEPRYDAGQRPVGLPDIVLTHDYLARGGFQTVEEALRSLPQNLGGTFNAGALFAGASQITTPQSAASTVNLRGLGSDSTLVLVNGQRLAPSEGSGAVDVSLIPISAVERIDITTGSASALFGSDAVAGVVNIVIRSDFHGLELSSALGTAAHGGGFLQHHSAAWGYVGADADVFAVADCAWQHEIDAQQRDYMAKELAGTTLMPGTRRCSELLRAGGSLTDTLEFSLLGAFTSRSADQAAVLTVPKFLTSALSRADVDQYTLNAVLNKSFLRTWTATLSAGLSVDNLASEQLLKQTDAPDQGYGELLDNRLWTSQLVASGALPEIGRRTMQVALGAGYNRQEFVFADLPAGLLRVPKRRHVRFAFAESSLPLIPSPASAKLPPVLSLESALRAEQYSEVGNDTTYKLMLQYQPTPSVKVQASRGTSLRVPTLLQQFNTQQALLEVVPDATQLGSRSLAVMRFGGNALLKPERSTDTELTLTLTPEVLTGASLTITYFDISYQQRIGYPTPSSNDPLSDRNVAPFVIRNPGPAYLAQILQRSLFTDLTAGRFSALQASLVIDDRYQNLLRQKARGIDILGKFSCSTEFGQWDTSLNAAYLDLQQQVANETTPIRLSGTAFNPPVWRGRFAVNWRDDPYLASLFVNYTDALQDVGAPGQPTVPAQTIASWTTLDGQVGINFHGGAYRGDTKLTLSVQNMFDRHPPLIHGIQPGVAALDYDPANASPVGRFWTLQLTQTW